MSSLRPSFEASLMYIRTCSRCAFMTSRVCLAETMSCWLMTGETVVGTEGLFRSTAATPAVAAATDDDAVEADEDDADACAFWSDLVVGDFLIDEVRVLFCSCCCCSCCCCCCCCCCLLADDVCSPLGSFQSLGMSDSENI